MEFSDDFHFDSEATELQLTKPVVEENPNEIFRAKVVDRLIDEHRSKNDFNILDENPDLEDTLRDITTIVNKSSSNITEEEKYNFKNVLTQYENISSFMAMKLSKPILKALTEGNITKPTPIQEACIPVGLMNKDICACAKTGSGKTLAFLIPIVEKLIRSNPPKGRYTVPRAVVLSPTRELALQIYEVTQTLLKFCPRLSTQLVSGGLNRTHQEASLRHGADIIIATPGRLIDIIHNTPNFDLFKIEFLVLDEADKMLDEYFIEQIKEVVRGCSPTRQVMLFSATMTENVKDLIALSLKDPFKIFVNDSNDVADNLQQEVVRIRSHRAEDREPMLLALICRAFSKRTIVFLPTKSLCHRMHILMGLLGIRCAELHSNMTQMQRLDALGRFARAEEQPEERVDVLVGTDLAARGLDVANVETVINYALPTKYEQYVHRVGRTARNMRSGRAISLVAEDERNMLKQICRGSKTGVKMRKIDPEVVEFYAARINDLNATVAEIIEKEKLEKETQIAEIELEKAQKRMEDGGAAEATAKRFNWFSNRDAKGMKMKRPHGRGGDDNEGDSDDDGEGMRKKKKSKKADSGVKHFSRKIEKESKKKVAIKPKNRKKK